MLKLVWTPGAAAAPDDDDYRQAIDTLHASYGGAEASVGLPRDTTAAVTGRDALVAVVQRWLAARTSGGPVKLMLHGFDYNPRTGAAAASDPFTLVYGYPGALGPNPRLSWLPLVRECDAQGGNRQETAIAFAWVSTGTLLQYGKAGWSEPYEYACVDLVALAARAVAEVLHVLADENLRVDVLAHSLGTRLFTKAVAAYGPDDGPLNNVVLLDGAEFSVDAAATFAGRQFNVVNVTNAGDAVLSIGGEQLGDPSRPPGSIESCTLGRFGLGPRASWDGIPTAYPDNWVDIALDRADVQHWFGAHGGYVLTATDSDNVHASGNMNHWAAYTEPGNRAWVTDLLWKPGCNGAAFANTPGLPTGITAASPVFAGFGIPTRTPMTMNQRIAFQRDGQGGAIGVA